MYIQHTQQQATRTTSITLTHDYPRRLSMMNLENEDIRLSDKDTEKVTSNLLEEEYQPLEEEGYVQTATYNYGKCIKSRSMSCILGAMMLLRSCTCLVYSHIEITNVMKMLHLLMHNIF